MARTAPRWDFDWTNSKARYHKDGSDTVEVELESGYLDIITHRLQLRRDLQAGKQAFSYPVISRGKLKQYNYQVASEQILNTAVGPLNTVKVERITEDSDKSVSVWLATDWTTTKPDSQGQNNWAGTPPCSY